MRGKTEMSQTDENTEQGKKLKWQGKQAGTESDEVRKNNKNQQKSPKKVQKTAEKLLTNLTNILDLQLIELHNAHEFISLKIRETLICMKTFAWL